MNQCFVCRSFKNTILIQADEGKDKVFCILRMLRIHTGLRKWIKTNKFDLHLKQMNPFGIHEPCIKISNNELIFEQYRTALNQEKHEIEVQNDDAIKRNQILFAFMQWKFNRLDGLYLHQTYILIDTIMEYQTRKWSAAEIEKLNREIKDRNKKSKVHPSLLQRSLVL